MTTGGRSAAYRGAMMGKRLPSAAATAVMTPPSQRPFNHHPADAKVTPMIHPSDPTFTRPLAVRDGQGAPVTCASCGCRLAQTGDAWFHFNPLAGRDARGCRVTCADSAHDLAGRPVSVAV